VAGAQLEDNQRMTRSRMNNRQSAALWSAPGNFLLASYCWQWFLGRRLLWPCRQSFANGILIPRLFALLGASRRQR